MKKIYKTIGSASFGMILSLGLISCGTSDVSQSPPVIATESSAAEETSEQVDRFASGYIGYTETIMDLQDKKQFMQNNFIMTNGVAKFAINAYGKINEAPEGKVAAEGEVLHAFHYSYIPLNNMLLTVSIDGKDTIEFPYIEEEGTLYISAPEDAEMLLNVEFEGVTQTMDMKTSERKTVGIADDWYENTVGVIGNGDVSYAANIAGKTAILTQSFTEAKKVPFNNQLGWADAGKQSWLIIKHSEPKWQVQEGNPINQKDTIEVIDPLGKTYPGQELENEDFGSTAFLVPSEMDKFTVRTTHITEITSFGNIEGNSGTVNLDQVSITFEGAK